MLSGGLVVVGFLGFAFVDLLAFGLRLEVIVGGVVEVVMWLICGG